MITRRSLLVGSAAAAGTLALAGTAQAAPAGNVTELRGGNLAVKVRTRAGWSANEALRFKDGKEIWPPAYFKVQTLTVHHEGGGTGDEPAQRVRNILQMHAVDNGWGDIGYHLLIGADGVIFEGRYSGTDCVPVFDTASSVTAVNAGHVLGYNAANVGICLLGNLSEAQPTAAALESLARTAAVLCKRTGLDPLGTTNYVNPINGSAKTVPTMAVHNDWDDSTECPGKNLAPKLPQVRARVAELLRRR